MKKKKKKGSEPKEIETFTHKFYCMQGTERQAWPVALATQKEQDGGQEPEEDEDSIEHGRVFKAEGEVHRVMADSDIVSRAMGLSPLQEGGRTKHISTTFCA